MTDTEAQAVRRELIEFRHEWEEAQTRRAAERRWLIGLVAPILATYVATTIAWGWGVSTQVHSNTTAIVRADQESNARGSHETRIAVVESRLVRMEGTLDAILSELRRERRRADASPE